MIDLRSDTTTQPSAGMRSQMASAPVGDDVFGDDPSVNALQQRVASLAGKGSALLLPSGTQSNLVALLAHCQRGEEYLVGQDYHTYLYEAGGAAVFGSIQPQPIPVSTDGSLDLELVRSRIKPDDPHFAITRLLVLENTHNGKVLGLDYGAGSRVRAMPWVGAASRWRAGLQRGDRAWRGGRGDRTSCGQRFDLFFQRPWAPVGSVLCGSGPFIAAAKRWRKLAGGGLRQAGVLAAAIDYALDHHVDRLRSDHAHAKRLAQAMSEIDAITLISSQTNMVFIELPDEDIGVKLGQFLAERGVNVLGGKRMRLVTHLDISAADTDTVIALFREFFVS